MTLHEAIEQLLRQKGRSMKTQEIADELNKNGWYKKIDGSSITAFQIHGRTRKYPVFDRDSSLISLQGLKSSSTEGIRTNTFVKSKVSKASKSDSDESYVLDICDKVLCKESSRQHRFNFLLGDGERKVKLPVDAYYKKLNIIVEYRECKAF